MRDYPEKLSIIIPVFNESSRIQAGLKEIAKWHQAKPGWEFIIVNDGSTDNTASKIKKFKFIKLISYEKNQGKGFALKQGVAQAKKSLVLLSDIDFSTPLTELPKLYEKIPSADLLIGSRKMAGANVTKHQPWWREWLGRQFTNLTNLWLGIKVSDATCGFKLIKTQAAKQLFKLQKINRWSYDAEILFLAKKLGFPVAEVPVVWENDSRTKVRLLPDIFRSLWDLILIRVYHD